MSVTFVMIELFKAELPVTRINGHSENNTSNNNNNNHDNIYSHHDRGHYESSLDSPGECRTAPSGRRPSDQAT